MIEEIFYCEHPRCSVYNKKTQDLAYNLRALRNSEFVFSEKFTPVMFFEVLKNVYYVLYYLYILFVLEYHLLYVEF